MIYLIVIAVILSWVWYKLDLFIDIQETEITIWYNYKGERKYYILWNSQSF